MDGDLQRYEQYVDELPEESVKSIHYEEVVTGTVRPIATK